MNVSLQLGWNKVGITLYHIPVEREQQFTVILV